jgi:tRNA dimethylallyltransferase
MTETGTAVQKPKILVILGPTASGKSGLAVLLAQEFNGEVISADSRQVYKGLNIGSGKITPAEMENVPHHMLDVADPQERYTVAEWKTAAEKSVQEILGRDRLPIICGGTGFYIDAIIKNTMLPNVPHDEKLQKELAEKTSVELMEIIRELDPDRADELDPNNRRRIIRSIEIAKVLGKVPEIATEHRTDLDIYIIGIQTLDETLRANIITRLLARMDAGMLDEARRLLAHGLSYERMNELGLEYRYLAELLQGNLTHEQFIETLSAKIWQYSRRQKTWFKRDKNINWFEISNEARLHLIGSIQKFLNK